MRVVPDMSITLEGIDRVIENLEKVLPLAEASGEHHLDMQEMGVNSPGHHACGTAHCAAGWYAVSQEDTERWRLKCFQRQGYINYEVGAHWMAQDVGFTGGASAPKQCLEEWANSNPKIWGISAELRQIGRAHV